MQDVDVFESTILISTTCAFKFNYVCDTFRVDQVPNAGGDYERYAYPGPFEQHFYELCIPTKQEGIINTLLVLA